MRHKPAPRSSRSESMLRLPIKLQMESVRRAIPVTVDRILEASRDAHLAKGQQENLAIALSEALANAAIHGNRLQPHARVGITVKVHPGDRVVIDIKDSGTGFDPDSVGDCCTDDRVLATGGRGVFLMRQLVDRVEYNRQGNRVRLVVERR
jgi:serine/threonine-protein kinase RsbW